MCVAVSPLGASVLVVIFLCLSWSIQVRVSQFHELQSFRFTVPATLLENVAGGGSARKGIKRLMRWRFLKPLCRPIISDDPQTRKRCIACPPSLKPLLLYDRPRFLLWFRQNQSEAILQYRKSIYSNNPIIFNHSFRRSVINKYI
jgi:hypothetical protein